LAFDFIRDDLAQRRDNQLLRQRFALPQGHGRMLSFDGKQYLNFSGNDYLGMASHPQVIQSAHQALDQYGAGSGGSALVTGFGKAQSALEEYLCDWLGVQRCLLFNAGFAANSGVIQTLMTHADDTVIQDKLNHASLVDAGLNCAAKLVRYRHNDLRHLQQKLALTNPAKGNHLVVTEGVFSMDGDSAPLAQIQIMARASDSWLMVDDAHGFGVLGDEGKGTANAQGLKAGSVDITMATFGKAVGTMGAFVAASADTIEYLVQFCRHYIYSTAMPAYMAAATHTSLLCLAKEQWRRDKLTHLIGYFKTKMVALGLADNHSDTAIQPLIIGCAGKTLQISQALKDQGIWLTAIRPPTVAANTARLRVTLHCLHHEADIDHLFNALEQAIDATN
jgi:8-amino-7-oxononanoate synthase